MVTAFVGRKGRNGQARKSEGRSCPFRKRFSAIHEETISMVANNGGQPKQQPRMATAERDVAPAGQDPPRLAPDFKRPQRLKDIYRCRQGHKAILESLLTLPSARTFLRFRHLRYAARRALRPLCRYACLHRFNPHRLLLHRETTANGNNIVDDVTRQVTLR